MAPDIDPVAGRRPRLCLALGGGGVRGLAHVAVLSVLEREGIAVDGIAGTSAGSVVGAAYAAGMRAGELRALSGDLGWRHLARPSTSRAGLLSLAPLEALVDHHLGCATFADLALPFAAVAADPTTGQAVVLREGRVARAVHASCAVPGIVAPVEVGGRPLVDGGIVNNLPVRAARALCAGDDGTPAVVVAVSLFALPEVCPPTAGTMLTTAADLLIRAAGDDPASADVHIAVPLCGLASVVRLSRPHRDRAYSAGLQAGQAALPAIRAALARK